MVRGVALGVIMVMLSYVLDIVEIIAPAALSWAMVGASILLAGACVTLVLLWDDILAPGEMEEAK